MDYIFNFDGNILLWIQENLRTDFLNPFVIFITKLGDGGAIWIAASLMMLLFPQSRKTGILIIAALLTSLFVNNLVLKNLVARPRPWVNVEGLEILINRPRDYSFPSGHTASSFAAAVVICKNTSAWSMTSWKTEALHSLSQKAPVWHLSFWNIFSRNIYSWIGAAAIFMALAIAMSRLYIGVHYPSDVLCGAISGIIIALVVCRLFEGSRISF